MEHKLIIEIPYHNAVLKWETVSLNNASNANAKTIYVRRYNSSDEPVAYTSTTQGTTIWSGVGTIEIYGNNESLGTDINNYVRFVSNVADIRISGDITALLYGKTDYDPAVFDRYKATPDFAYYGLFANAGVSRINLDSHCLNPAGKYSLANMFASNENLVSVNTDILHTTSVLGEYCCANMFSFTSLSTAPTLPATTLAKGCYSRMFRGCTSLSTAPTLPATTLTDYCYEEMFDGCSSLTTTPTLPATSLAYACYQYMFRLCSRLTSVSSLPATVLSNRCYFSMFQDCTSLVNAPSLSATTLANGCYAYMFRGCTSLVNAPELTATVLTTDCYAGMFYGCTALVNAPELPATVLSAGCYYEMFSGCTSLTTAPILPATTLVSQCYQGMFSDCESLNYVKAYFTTTPGSLYTSDWLRGVSAVGTFFKNSQAQWDVSGSSGIPEGWTVQNEYINLYFCITSLEDNNQIKFAASNSSYTLNIQISTDLVHWTNYTSSTQGTYLATLNSDDKLYIRGTNTSYSYNNGQMSHSFISTKQVNLSGNIMSLIYGGDYNGNTTLTGTYNFSSLFSNLQVIDASLLILPATTLTDGCYAEMFYGCSSLVKAPVLYATTLAESCYQAMFSGCSSLTTPPLLPATTLADSCYLSMFSGCSSLTSTPVLSATTLTEGCYSGMFSGCSSLTTPPSLPATTLATGCYYGMFWGCTSLEYAPVLPATTLVSQCYGAMFYGCTSLEYAPVLPATTLVDRCYDHMFNGCRSLHNVRAYFTTTPGASYTSNWLNNVAPVGIFAKSSEATWEVIGASGIPAGWVVEDEYESSYLCFTSLENSNIIRFVSEDSAFLLDIQVSTDLVHWTTYRSAASGGRTIATLNTGEKIYIKGNNSAYYNEDDDEITNYFTSSKKINISGNIMSLVYGDSFRDNNTLTTSDTFDGLFHTLKVVDASHLILPATRLTAYCYFHMFANCTYLTSAPELPATKLSGSCYSFMFNGCTSLVNAPSLPATTLSLSCYAYMFQGCTSLVNAPSLPATTLASSCYTWMFAGCTSLVNAPSLPATTLAITCYANMFNGCTSLTTAPSLPATTLTPSCYSNMFRGCTSLTTAPYLPATTLVNSCYASMFYDCTSLNYIQADFTTTPGSSYTSNWVKNVASTGTFVQGEGVTWTDRGVSACPVGWNITSSIIQYFRITSLENDNVIGISSSISRTLYYSSDQITWNQIESQRTNQTISTLGANDKLYLKSTSSTLEGLTFSATKKINLSGNLNSLVNGDNFEVVGYCRDNMCYELFKGLPIVDASKLIIPWDNLGESSYSGMFMDCIYLTGAPRLNATNIYHYSYENMFSGCTSLTAAPALPATTLSLGCYIYMFSGCTSLTTAPSLSATTLAVNCYSGMFQDCTSLTTAPALPATTLAAACYTIMFSGCTSLTTAPALPATTLADTCYSGMFKGCTSLVDAPTLPATTLTDYCYQEMFSGCTSLVNAPKLYAKTTKNNSYYGMFDHCSSLTELTMYSSNYPGLYFTDDFQRNGTFICLVSSTWVNESTVPQGWLISKAGIQLNTCRVIFVDESRHTHQATALYLGSTQIPMTALT